MLTWDAVAAFAATLPEVEESTSWGTPSLKVRGKMFCRLRTDSDGALAVKCSAEDKASLVASPDPAFYTIAHYDRYNYILVDLGHADPDEVRELLTDAWRIAAPARLRKAFES